MYLILSYIHEALNSFCLVLLANFCFVIFLFTLTFCDIIFLLLSTGYNWSNVGACEEVAENTGIKVTIWRWSSWKSLYTLNLWCLQAYGRLCSNRGDTEGQKFWACDKRNIWTIPGEFGLYPPSPLPPAPPFCWFLQNSIWINVSCSSITWRNTNVYILESGTCRLSPNIKRISFQWY